ncbi:MAG: type II secretion system protein [bacterium]|nr:type II secretion system protein [bacterium]
MQTPKRSGFTLVELLIVAAIIGILGSIVVASISGSKEKARDSRRASDMREIQIALALYYDVNRVYPDSLATLAEVNQRFLPSVPKDPYTGADYEYVAAAGFKNYCIGVTFEGSKPSDLPDTSDCTLSGGSTANYKASPQR